METYKKSLIHRIVRRVMCKFGIHDWPKGSRVCASCGKPVEVVFGEDSGTKNGAKTHNTDTPAT